MGAFTEEQIAILSKNPYVDDVIGKRLAFTKEFRVQFMSAYNSGKKPSVIFAEHGFDTKMLGAERIRGYSRNIRNEYYGRERKSYCKSSGCNQEPQSHSQQDELKQLRHEVNYLRQEVDFLKKISSIRITRKSQKSS